MSSFAVEPARPDLNRSYRDGVGVIDSGEQSAHHDNARPMAIPVGNGGVGATIPPDQEYNAASTGQRMISATWGSLITSLFVTPLDVVRIRLQSQTRVAPVVTAFTSPSVLFKELPPNLGVTACCREVFWVGDNAQACMVGPNVSAQTGRTVTAGCMVEETQRKTFTSTLDALRKISRHEGPRSLWRGLSPTLVMAIPANVIYFTGYDWLRYDRRSPIKRYTGDVYTPLVAGAVARIAAAAAISPIEMFRTRLQATSGNGTDHFRGTLRGLHELTRSQGYSSLWRGLTLTMWRDVPFSAMYWWGYEATKEMLVDFRAKQLSHSHLPSSDEEHSRQPHHPLLQDNTMTFLDSFVAGAISGAVAAFVTMPFDVGKTRQQIFLHTRNMPVTLPPVVAANISSPSTTKTTFTTSSFTKLLSSISSPSSSPSSSSPLRPEQLSIPRFLLHIFREEGMAGLYRGWAARCLKVAPACAIMISSYELGKKMAGQVNERGGLTDADADSGSSNDSI
ncbi:hypothetical protein AJ80_08972 [Polytolypa hystricis UAMH7299]|uniref:Mitochondrial thiamine pyrophosphate carrier 1 n=1 Tax=Polytolypa hystricis (strain UAMH7299) TaxID=1447883 RepID=A0A2B7WYD8_POLH7|nr:hypothetical protein AJ80_08972 [Polytolypa hystricis UAMH7299]